MHENYESIGKKRVSLPLGQVVHQAGAYLRFLWHEATRSIFTPPWMGCQSITGLPPALNLPVPIYTPELREALRVKCFAQEHNTMSLARARTWITRSGDEGTNHEATVPSTMKVWVYLISCFPLF